MPTPRWRVSGKSERHRGHECVYKRERENENTMERWRHVSKSHLKHCRYVRYSLLHVAGDVVPCPEWKWCHQRRQTDPLLWFHCHKPQEIPHHHLHSMLSFFSPVLLQHSWLVSHARSFTWRIRLRANPSQLAWTFTRIAHSAPRKDKSQNQSHNISIVSLRLKWD